MLRPEIRHLLACSSILRGIPFDAVEPLIDGCGLMTLGRGEALMEPGATNNWLYVILSGQVRVYPGGRDLPAQATLGPGECVGEISLLDGRGASALVIASEPTEVFIIDNEVLWAMTDAAPGIARNLMCILAGRIRRSNQSLVSTQTSNLEFEKTSGIDPVTGLHTRRWLMENFPRVIRRCVTDGVPLCLALLDLDHLAAFNDRRGHLMGDTLLRGIAERLVDGLRFHDLIARSDARTFAILLPSADLDTAERVAHRLRETVAAVRVPIDEDGNDDGITVSIGVATMHPGEALETLLGAAEHALLRAKAQGRDRVELAR